jgi:predicted secreted protein
MERRHLSSTSTVEKQERLGSKKKGMLSGFLALAVAGVILVAAAGISLVSASSGTLVGSDSLSEVHLDVGEVFWVRLDSADTGQLQWTLKEISDPVVLEVIAHEYEPPSAANGYVGREVWSFRATSKGITTVTLERAVRGDSQQVVVGVVVK